MARAMILLSPPPFAETNEDGFVIMEHIAHEHWSVKETGDHGEFFLCGKAISYVSYKGTIEDAPECPRCRQMDC